MKKLLLTFICYFMFLLYIPFNTLAETYTGDIAELGLSQIQLDKVQELFDDSYLHQDYLIYYNSYNNKLYWAFEYISYDAPNTNFLYSTRFCLDQDGNLTTFTDNTNAYLNGSHRFFLAKYQGNIIFKNPNLSYSNISENYFLLSKSYENVVRSHSTSAAMSPRTRYFSYVDYDIRYTIKGYNFDVYYLVDDTYKLIQRNINTFTIYDHDNKSNFKDSSTPDDYPSYPTVPSNTKETYQSSFKLFNFYFVINDEIDLNTIIVKAPETDNLISDGNSNSQTATSNNNQSNQILDNTVNQMESLENGFKNDLNSNLNNINSTDFNITGITQLSNAANFVRVQFDNLTKNNPFGTIIGFSLFLGLSLLIIGKRL